MTRVRRTVDLLQEFSLPLIVGVVVAMLAANLAYPAYDAVLHWQPLGDVSVFGHPLTFHFLVNDVFMVFFFGIAAKEITESCLPGGSLNPLAKAVNPLLATLGGVVGPALVFVTGLALLFQAGVYDPQVDDRAALLRGWGVPTATDIALAWLTARAVFGRGHPAVDFLLLLAVADDGIGLVIIAIFYGDATQPAQPQFLALTLAGMAAAFGMRHARVRSWLPYVAVGGPLAWCGLMMSHLHPALALVFIVPFMPAPRRDVGLFVDADEVDAIGEEAARRLHLEHSPLHNFSHQLKLFVDFGLFFFAFANAGVPLTEVGPLTWLVLAALVIGKTVGITSFGLLAVRLGFPLPDRMGVPELVMAAYVASLGLTVALFVAEAAFLDPVLLGQGKMGAVFTAFVGISAVAIGRTLGMASRRAGAPVVGRAAAGESDGAD